jgi:hypothetical protein
MSGISKAGNAGITVDVAREGLTSVVFSFSAILSLTWKFFTWIAAISFFPLSREVSLGVMAVWPALARTAPPGKMISA